MVMESLGELGEPESIAVNSCRAIIHSMSNQCFRRSNINSFDWSIDDLNDSLIIIMTPNIFVSIHPSTHNPSPSFHLESPPLYRCLHGKHTASLETLPSYLIRDRKKKIVARYAVESFVWSYFHLHHWFHQKNETIFKRQFPSLFLPDATYIPYADKG